MTLPSFIDTFFDNVCELDLVFNFYKVGNFVQLCDIIAENILKYRSTRSLMKYFSLEKLRRLAKM